MSASTGRAEIHASLLHQRTDSARGEARDHVVQQVSCRGCPKIILLHRERAPKRVQPETVSAQGQERTWRSMARAATETQSSAVGLPPSAEQM
jgi:hypothetical protein